MRRFPTMGTDGIYNCRSVRGGGSISEHAEGRAWDCHNKLGDPEAQRVADLLVAHADALGLQSVIYNRRVWGYGRWNWRAYSGVDPHTTHVHVGMNIQASNTMTEAAIEAILAGTGGGAPPPQPPQQPPQQPPVVEDPPTVASCVQAKQGVNIRTAPSTSGTQVLLAAMAGERFTKIDERSGWIRVTNSRGSGWSFGIAFFFLSLSPLGSTLTSFPGTFWTGCSAMRSVVESDDGGAEVTTRIADGPGGEAIPNWVFGLIGFVGGAIVAAAVAVVIVMARNRSQSSNELPLMEHKVGSAGSSSVIPQIRRRNSFGKL